MNLLEKLFLLSLVAASVSFTVTETILFRPVREWFQKRAVMKHLFSCGYCLGHWVALALVLGCRFSLFGVWRVLDYAMTTLAVAWLAGIQVVFMCILMKKAGK